MARIRTIKPEFFTSEDIVELDPFARLLYISLWCEADKEGRLTWKPRTFKMRYFPADEIDIDAMCDALVTRGLVSLYGDSLAYIPSFKDHQHINPRETDSKLPPPPDAPVTRQPRVSDEQGGREGKGREGKGKEGNDLGAGTSAKKSDIAILLELGVSEQAAKDWLKVRKAKRAPLTQSALDDLIREAGKAGITPAQAVEICAKKSWQGFNSTWNWKGELQKSPAKTSDGFDSKNYGDVVRAI